MPVIECDQGSPEWITARLGVATASCFDKIVKPDGAPSQSSDAYMYRLITELIYRETMDDANPELALLLEREDESIANLFWVRRGKELEGDAAEDFALRYNVALDRVGFVIRKDGRAGCSPDRLIAGYNEAVEIKCPSPWQHLQYLDQGPGKNYKQQVQGQMLIGGYDAVHFYSYFPGWPCVSHITRKDETFIRMLERELNRFLKKMDETVDRMRKLGAFVQRRPETATAPLQMVIPD